MDLTIRQYSEKDYDRVREICTATAPPVLQKKRDLLLALYCDYYIEQEPDNCFMLADENDCVVGYVLIAENEQKYRQIYTAEYLPKVKKYSPLLWLVKKGALKKEDPKFLPFPAHLHIDILPEYQDKGLGAKLLDAAFAHLKSKKVPSIMLGVSTANKKAVRFYERYGFKPLVQKGGVLYVGLTL